jgi:hypothetical protein
VTRHSAASRVVSAGLSICGAVVVALSTFQTWYRFFWHRGVVGEFVTPFNLYQLSSRPGAGWNAFAPAFVLAGAAVLLVSGLAVLGLARFGSLARWAPLATLIGVIVVAVSSVSVSPPNAGGWPVSRGPGLWVALTGAGLSLIGLLVLAPWPGVAKRPESVLGPDHAQVPG